ncbi:DUF6388 family protein [Pseudomonas nunensis]|uniref:DUF6388 family protein n=1 Tax=Pseudomonas nunensis TaxID=2961896 RepID=UPI0025AFDF17|nr:DUF6388 family protein [Pseudomonas nunensis]MDN3223498.1 DUF6388 family protein [Pseudomonas nunensis]
MVTRKKVAETARSVFLAERPRLNAQILALTEDIACGSTLDEYKTVIFQNELLKEAERQGLTPWGYQLEIAESLGLDVSALREEDQRAEAEALGVDSLM